MKIKKIERITFDDVLMVPRYSEVKSRNDVNISVKIKDYSFSSFITNANMKTVVGFDMAKSFIDHARLTILHRFSMEDQFNLLGTLRGYYPSTIISKFVGVSLGIKDVDIEAFKRFKDLGVSIFCIDIAHCDNKYALDFIQYIAENNSAGITIAGNIATGDAANRLWDLGADICKVGIGGSMVCTTRTQTGCGMPTLSSLIDVSEAWEQRKDDVYFMADGGIRNPGDAAKSLAAGASMIMMGGVLAGTSLSPGEIVELNGKKYKKYEGSSTYKDRVEGVKSLKEYEGNTEDIISNFHKGVQSACSYNGVSSLNDLHKVAEFIKITGSGTKESYPHDVLVVK
jgi:IMP dehydrogenase